MIAPTSVVPQLKASQLITLLTAIAPSRKPVLIEGEPGIGKTAVVGQLAQLLDYDLIVSHPALDDPTDGKGFPTPDGNGGIDFMPAGQLKRVLNATRPTIWFLDDFGQALSSVQATYMQWLHGRECAGHVLPDCVWIIAATNGRTHRAGVGGMLEPVKSRFVTIVELVADVDEFCTYWTQPGSWMPPEMIAFQRLRGHDLLSKFEPSADMTNSPSPRTWENAAHIITLGLPADIENVAVQGAVGAAAGSEFLSFLRFFNTLPDIDAILADPDGADIPDRPNTLYAVVTALAARATSHFGNVCRYAERLAAAGQGEFASLLVNDATRRDPDLKNTKVYAKLISGPIGHLMTGGVA